MNSPSTTAAYHNKAHSNHSQTHVESPLRKASFPVDVEGKAAFDHSHKIHDGAHPRSDSAWESDTEDDEIHVDAPAFRTSKYTGNGYDPPTEDLGPFGGNTDVGGGWIQETGYGVPILASDEVAKEPGLEYLQPAVSPVQERRGSTHYAGIDSDAPPSYQSGYRNQSRPGSAANSRPSSRPASIHGSLPGPSRFALYDEREDNVHTPLENVDEYEPLFPDDEDEEARPMSATEKFKRRESLKRRFPSQDIWEDTPNSLQLQATVETPEPTEEADTSTIQEKRETPGASAVFESPEAEAKRKGEIGEAEKATLIPQEQSRAKPHWKPHLREAMDRPGLKQRFPSQDIWEDSPDSACLETTVEAPQIEEPRSPPNEGEAFDTSGRLDKGVVGSETAGDGSLPERRTVHQGNSSPTPLTSEISGKSKDAGGEAIPNVPARPAQRLHQVPPANITSDLPKTSTESVPTDPRQVPPSESRKAPVVPDRPKPQIPARPPRSGLRDASETTPLSKTTSASSTGSGGAKEESQVVTSSSSPPPPNPKPVLPSRPVGSKIASLKAGFLSDLDKRLQMGPRAPKAPEKAPAAEPEPEGEKAPLTDARKGRARGPPRRKPAAPSVAAAAVEEEGVGVVKQTRSNWVIEEPWTVWQTEDDGSINALHAAHPSVTPKKESGQDGAPRPPVPMHSSDSISAGDTPTSSRDETVPTPDDPTSSGGFTTGASTGQLKEEIAAQAQARSGELHPGRGETEGAEQASDSKAVGLNADEDRERKSPADLNAGEHEEGGVPV